MKSAEILVIGAGLTGLTTAYQLLQAQPGRRVVVLDKEPAAAQQQSARRWALTDGGVRFAAGTQAAWHSRYGVGQLAAFCQREQLPWRACGQLLIAGDASALPQLNAAYQRGLHNGATSQLIDSADIHAIEPYATGLQALHLPHVALVNPYAICAVLARKITQLGGDIVLNSRAVGINERPEGVIVSTRDKRGEQTWVAQQVINAAGLYANRVAKLSGVTLPVDIVPFRGEYVRLRHAAAQRVQAAIAPAPSAELPFPGIGLTRTLDGDVYAGPNAILAGGREQTRKGQISLRTSAENLRSAAVRRLTRRYFQTALWEQRRSWSLDLMALTLQRFVPAIESGDLVRADAGVQGYAVSADGTFVNDLVFIETPRTVHVLSLAGIGASVAFSVGKTITQWAR